MLHLVELHMAEWFLCRKCNRRLIWRLEWFPDDSGEDLLARPDTFSCPCGENYQPDQMSPHDTCPALSYDCPHCDLTNDLFPATEDHLEEGEVEVEDDLGEEKVMRVTKHQSVYEVESMQECRHCGKTLYAFPAWVLDNLEEESDEDNHD
jgi:hypothetical protein